MKIIKFYIDILLAAPITQIFLIGSDIDLFTGQENWYCLLNEQEIKLAAHHVSHVTYAIGYTILLI